MHRHLRALIPAALALTAVALPVDAAEPGAGTVDDTRTRVSWTGSTPAQSAGISEGGCIVAARVDPTCDFFELTVGELTEPADDVVVSISTTDGGVAEFDLYVYDASGAEVGRSTDFGSNDSFTIVDPAPAAFTVAVHNALSTNVANSYAGVAEVIDSGGPAPIDTETACGLESMEHTPVGRPDDVVGANGLVGDPLVAAAGVDRSDRVSLDVLVLLHGIPQAEASDLFGKAQRSFEPLNVDLTVADFHDVTDDPAFATDDGMALIRAAKAHVGGARPAGIDVVQVLTATDIQQLGQRAVAGIADCVGGVAHDDRAFLVAEGRSPSDLRVGPLLLVPDVSANITAHEIGHLLGGHHHYGSCVEGVQPTDVRDDGTVEVTPCTLMFNAADLIGPQMSSLNAAVARGSVATHARP